MAIGGGRLRVREGQAGRVRQPTDFDQSPLAESDSAPAGEEMPGPCLSTCPNRRGNYAGMFDSLPQPLRRCREPKQWMWRA